MSKISTYYPYKKSQVWYPNHKSRSVRLSAFRAINNTANQLLPANAASQVLFQNEQFDLANEYNPNTSTFIPQMDGVYSLTASVEFQPNIIGEFTLEIAFLINSDVIEGRNSETFTGNIPGILTTTEVLQLNVGDQVQVAMRSTAAGAIQAMPSTHFAAARVPSPTT
ncbi:C1q-like domain-containing protein [Priestia endophytica]|uniref:C1q-like domain-containing protein n=1 Tax=Priestia endophytica TaxID=135735 RepID=UPI00124C2E9A|nr:hypothetical protein [Priestia endophytica]KAB2488093.1 hypothetical protein F8155_25500 [Priestia endophytica]